MVNCLPEKSMLNTMSVVGLAMLAAAGAARAQTDKPQYLTMAPVALYLSPSRDYEIANARSAAPPSISDHAEIMTLGLHGFVSAVKGTNGFVCLVQRAWFAEVTGLDNAEFWNPRSRAAICFNPQGVRSVLPMFLKRTEWVMSGMSKAEIITRTRAAVAANEITAPESGTLTYMMAKDAYHSDNVHGPWHPHLMLFLPRMNVSDWGANLRESPVMGAGGSIEPFTLFFIPVTKWSDGTLDTTQRDK